MEIACLNRSQDLMVVSLKRVVDLPGPVPMQNMLDNFSDTMGFVDQDCRIRIANGFILEFLEISPNIIVGQTFNALFCGPFGERLNQGCGQSIETGKIITGSGQYAKGSDTLYLSYTFSPMAIKGRIVGSYFTLHDISPHLEVLRNTLDRRNGLLNTVMKTSQRLLSDTKNFEDHINEVLTILGVAAEVDRVFLWQFHASPFEGDDELYSTQLYEWFMGAEFQQDLGIVVNRPVSESMATTIDILMAGQCINTMVRDMPPVEQGQLTSRGILSLLLVPITFQGHLWGFISFDDCHNERTWPQADVDILQATGMQLAAAIQNQHTREAMEKANMQAAVADQANRTQSEFLDNMRHEIRTPMNAIMGMTYLALKTSLSPKQLDYLEKIQASTNALLNIINDILDFSKTEAGYIEIEEVPFRIDDSLSQFSNQEALKAHEKDLELVFAADPAAAMTVYMGDSLHLGQVLLNFLSNVVKFTEKGHVTLSIRAGEQKDDRTQIFFSVKDTGIGISPDQQADLFQPFNQVDTSTTRKWGYRPWPEHFQASCGSHGGPYCDGKPPR